MPSVSLQNSTYVQYGRVWAWYSRLWLCSGMHEQWMPSQKPTQRVRQGPRQPRRGGRRLIQPVQLAEAGDHLWSCVLHRTSYRRTDVGLVGYLVPFFFF